MNLSSMYSPNRFRLGKLSFLWLLIYIVPSYADADTCYYPDGSTAASMMPCPNSKACCGKNQACLSNGLCFGADLGVIYRGSCADKSWPIAECPRACYSEIQDKYANLFQCPSNGNWKNMTCSTRADAETACGEDAMGSWIWTAGGNVTSAQNGASTCEDMGSGNTTACTTAATDSTATVTASATTCPESSSSHPSTVALGAGLGAGLGIPLLISTALLIYCEISRRRLLASSQLGINQQTARVPTRPSELNGGLVAAEMADKTGMRSELQGS